MILAIGSLMDIKRAAYNIEAEKYHQLARATLFQTPIFEEPTMFAVQTLVRIHLLMWSLFSPVRLHSVFDGVLPLPLRASWKRCWLPVGVDGSGGEVGH